MNRRSFIRAAALLAVAVTACSRRLFAGGDYLPILYGDGVRDDTEAIRAMYAGRDVWDERARKVRRSKPGQWLPNGHYLAGSWVPEGKYRITTCLELWPAGTHEVMRMPISTIR